MSMNKRFLFDEAIEFLDQYQLELPGYSTLQDLIAVVSQAIENRLEKHIRSKLTSTDRRSLESLLQKEPIDLNVFILRKIDMNQYQSNIFGMLLLYFRHLFNVIRQNKFF